MITIQNPTQKIICQLKTIRQEVTQLHQQAQLVHVNTIRQEDSLSQEQPSKISLKQKWKLIRQIMQERG